MAITIAPANELGRQVVGQALAKAEAVEAVVDDIAQCTSHDEGDAGHEADGVFAAAEYGEQIDKGDNGHNAEGAEDAGPDEGHAEGHTAVLNEEDFAPRGDVNLLVEGHICLDHNLDNLVDDDDGHENGEGNEGTFLHDDSGVKKMGDKTRLFLLQGQSIALSPIWG